MAVQISINTEQAASIYQNSQNRIEQLSNDINELMTEIERLETDGEWKGAAATRFFEEYNELKPKFTNEFPEALHQIAENLNTNLKNLIEADAING